MSAARAAARDAALVRAVVQECWADDAGLDRMAGLVAPGYVHHTPWGDGDFGQFRAGVNYVGTLFAGRRYQVLHVLAESGMAAAFLRWSATRRSDGSAVDGRGAYHCRLDGGLIVEDWDVFAPMS